jgi:5-methylcytosine-specific restriction endonuclease McrA
MDRPLRRCAFPSCAELIRHPGYCRAHNSRPGHSQLYDHEWDEAARSTRLLHKQCSLCGQPTQEVHHDTPLRAGGKRFDPANMIPLCVSCHVTITARTRGTPVSYRRRRR